MLPAYSSDKTVKAVSVKNMFSLPSIAKENVRMCVGAWSKKNEQ